MSKNIGEKEQKMKGSKRERKKGMMFIAGILRSQSLQVQGKGDVSTPISSS